MQVNILGYGLMAKQIAALLYLGGFKISIWNRSKIDLGEVDRQIRLLKRTIDTTTTGEIISVDKLDDLEDYLTIESVVEDIDVKKGLYDKLKNRITKGYFTNSSSYSPNEIGNNVNGLHFYNPIMLKFVEHYDSKSEPGAVESILSYLRSLEFEIVPVYNNRGYIGNYILFHEISSALKLIEKLNYSVDSVNAFYKKLYDGRDIFTIVDIIGIDVVRAILVNLKAQDDNLYLPECLRNAMNKNVLGKKNKTSIKQVLP